MLFDKIPSHLPRAWVAGVLLWCAALMSVGAAIICKLAGSYPGFLIAFGVTFLFGVGFMLCGIWLIVEKAIGRVTPWRP